MLIQPIVKRRDTVDVSASRARSFFGRIGRLALGITLCGGLVPAANLSAQQDNNQFPSSLVLNPQQEDVTGQMNQPPVDVTQPVGSSTTNNPNTRRPGQVVIPDQPDYRPQTQQRPNDTTRNNNQTLRPMLPPEPLTEFQRLVAATTGRQLPIFGASMFRNDVPSTFAPVNNIPVAADYVIGPGDELRLQIWGQVNQQGSFMVDRTGAISVPQLGVIHVAGQRYDQLADFLRSQFNTVYRNFNLNVTLGQLRTIQVFVVGQARRPGSYTISSLSTLLNALFASGGPTAQGSLRDLQVRRGTQTVTHFDLYDLLMQGDKSKDVTLAPGDVIFIPPVGPQVALLGSVNTPAIYELKKDPAGTTVAELLELGGGRTSSAAGSQVRLERIVDRSVLTIADVDLSKPDSTTLQGGDIVSVLSMVDRFKNAVTLRGNVANPGRYVWHSGMRVSDLIPDKEALLTRDYWRKRNELGQLPESYQPEPEPPAPSSTQFRYTVPTRSNSTSTDNNPNNINPANNTQQTQGGTALQPTPNGFAPQGQGGSTPTGTGGESQSGQGGSSEASALTSSSALFPRKTFIVLSAPDIDWSYAVIERQNASDLTTKLIPFNLGKVILDGDQSQNLELLPGDMVTIFSNADMRVPTSQQTRIVRLEGEFNAAGIYSVQPGETLRQLLRRAGGFTPDAYLYASEFTRQSTKRVQQQRLIEYADQLEAQISVESQGLAQKAVSDRDAAAAAAAGTSARTAVSRLRQIEPQGRIVLPLKPDSRTVDDVPDLALEDGDRFVVPRTPSNVNVEGQVYSANAFVYEHNRIVKDYLRMAGGPGRDADSKRTFVLRADGSVYSQQYGKVDKATMFPGDTIVVPMKISQTAVLRNLVDIATIVGQFGLGIAAINVLK